MLYSKNGACRSLFETFMDVRKWPVAKNVKIRYFGLFLEAHISKSIKDNALKFGILPYFLMLFQMK